MFNSTRKCFPTVNIGTALLQKGRAVHSSLTFVSVFFKGRHQRNHLGHYDQSAKIVRIVVFVTALMPG